MKNDWWVALFGGLLLGGSAFLSSGQWYIGVGVGVTVFLSALFFVLPCFRLYRTENEKRHECYLFIHGYLVTLSVCMSLDKAFLAASEPMGKRFHELDETLATMEPKEKTAYLINYFPQNVYSMFLSVLELYLDRGGDVLKLSNELTQEAARIEESGAQYQKIAARKGASFFFLWAMAIAIMTFLRLGLSSFFESLKENWTYLGALVCFYLFFVISICVYAHFHTGKMPLFKGAKHEKTKS